MNILILAHFLPYPPHGGAIQRNINLLRGLSSNHNVHYLTFNQKIHLPSAEELQEGIENVSPYCTSLEVFDIPSDGSKLRWYFLLLKNIFRSHPYSVDRYYSKDFELAISRTLKEKSIDIVLIDTIALAQYIKSISDIPCILSHHNVESTLLFRKAKSTNNPIAKLYIWLQANKLRRYEHKISQAVAGNIVVSEVDEKDLLNLHPKAKTFVVANGTDTDYFQPKTATKQIPYRMIFAGGMAWYPNADAMKHFCRNIFPKIKEKIPEASMDIIGAHPPQEVIEIAKRTDGIKIHGFVDDVRDYIAKASLYVVPIRVGGGTRLKILDAMAQGKTIISTKIGAEGLDITDGRDILIADSDTEFVNKTIASLLDTKQSTSIAKSARESMLEKYSWQVIVPKLESAIKVVTQERS